MYYLGMNINIPNIDLTDDHHHLTETEVFHGISTFILSSFSCQKKTPKLLQKTLRNKSVAFTISILHKIIFFLPKESNTSS